MPDLQTVEPGSGAARIAAHLKANATEMLDRGDVARLLSIAIGAVDKVLQPAVDCGLLTMANDGDRGRVWRAGPRLKFWGDAPASTPAPAAARKTTRGGRQPRLPALDLAAYPARADVPAPAPKISRRGETRYDDLFNALSADGMSRIGMPVAYRPSMTKAAMTYMKNRPALAKAGLFVFRELEGGTFGIWRLARPAKKAA